MEVTLFTDKVGLKEFSKMDPEYRELLKRVLAIQADCEIGGPHLYLKDIMTGAPTKADQLMVAKTAAEELDHYRKIARLAGDRRGRLVCSQLAQPETLCRSVSRSDHDLGGFCHFRIFDRSGRTLSARRVHELQL